MADSGERSPGSGRVSRRRALRRSIGLAAGIVIAVITFAFAFHTTDVNLDKIQEETRRESLVRILRALAHPNLTTYDRQEFVVSAPLLMPCPVEAAQPESDTSLGTYLVIEPSCISSGGTATVEGFGFEPEISGIISFIPDSEFAVSLDLARFEADGEGRFSVEVGLPEGRDSIDLQSIETVTRSRIGTWANRVEVSTDSNLNGDEDTGELLDQMNGYGVLSVDLPEFLIRVPGGIALVNAGGDVEEFISFGGEFTATSGLAQFAVAQDVGTDFGDVGTSLQRIGEGERSTEFAWSEPTVATAGLPNVRQLFTDSSETGGTGVFINELDIDGDDAFFEIAAPAGTDLSGWRLIFYDAEDGRNYRSLDVRDQVQLSPRISKNAKDTWDKIIETVMLALLATTAGLLVAIPLSFLAARNLMRDVSTPILNIALTILAIPVGVAVGMVGARWAQSLSERLEEGVPVTFALVALVAVIWILVRRTVRQEDDEPPKLTERAVSFLALALAGFLVILALYLLSRFLVSIGEALEEPLGPLGFVGAFLASVGDILKAGLGFAAAVVAAGAAVLLAGRVAYDTRRTATQLARLLTYPLAMLAGAVVLAAIGATVEWFGQFETPVRTLWIPAIVGGILGLILAYRVRNQESVGTGLIIYYVARTIFNGIRSIEPLVMVIVFVVWVGIGPFAGSLALALHTTAALAKLYSEQVESISAGPIEALRATGATRAQTIVYAVVPQIIPPYISFTMYRWDINVRMSTIIGFAGGGGIGFLLQQNTGLLQYRDASVQMLAIAIVVASMDYVSSRLRERFV